MDPNDVHQTIAQQIDHMKPEHLTPGVDIGIEVVDERAIRVLVLPHQESYEIRLDPSDTYTVTRSVLDAQHRPIAAEQPLAGIYCDQLGEIIFGDEAKPWTQPMVQISDDDGETWKVIA